MNKDTLIRIYIVACITGSVMLDKGTDHLLAGFAGFLWAFGLPGFLVCACIGQGSNYALMLGVSVVFWLIVGRAAKASKQQGSYSNGSYSSMGGGVYQPVVYKRVGTWRAIWRNK